MNTIVKDWQIVTIVSENQIIGKVLYAIVVEDMYKRYKAGDYVTTSKIINISTDTQLIRTNSGSIYQVIGSGKKATIDLNELPLLRKGYSPDEISSFIACSDSVVH